MIAMMDTSEDLEICKTELGCEVEQLLTPLTRFIRQYPDRMFAIDNGGFKRAQVKEFSALLEREKEAKNLCRFVAVPDVVGDGRRTLELFHIWKNYGQLYKWPLALVAQDGMESLDIPWAEISAIFIGGTTEWKMGRHASAMIRAGQWLNKWVHVGRVNTPGRFEYFESLGVDSIDGSGLARYSWMRERIYKAQLEPDLFTAYKHPAEDRTD